MISYRVIEKLRDTTASNSRGSKISIVIPVLNEAGNVRTLIDQIVSLRKDEYSSRIDEVVFVDDGSTDGTTEIIREYSQKKLDLDIILKERSEKHGTVNAQLYGMSQCRNDTVIVMDGDLQHPVRYIPQLIAKYTEGYDLILGSRYIKDGETTRKLMHGVISRGATVAAKVILPKARSLKDPISGFFIVDRRLVNPAMEPNGHNKLSLFILCGSEKLTIAEIPYHFVERTNGKSKVVTDPFSYMFRFVDELLFYRHYHKAKNKVQNPNSLDPENKAAR